MTPAWGGGRGGGRSPRRGCCWGAGGWRGAAGSRRCRWVRPSGGSRGGSACSSRSDGKPRPVPARRFLPAGGERGGGNREARGGTEAWRGGQSRAGGAAGSPGGHGVGFDHPVSGVPGFPAPAPTRQRAGPACPSRQSAHPIGCAARGRGRAAGQAGAAEGQGLTPPALSAPGTPQPPTHIPLPPSPPKSTASPSPRPPPAPQPPAPRLSRTPESPPPGSAELRLVWSVYSHLIDLVSQINPFGSCRSIWVRSGPVDPFSSVRTRLGPFGFIRGHSKPAGAGWSSRSGRDWSDPVRSGWSSQSGQTSCFGRSIRDRSGPVGPFGSGHSSRSLRSRPRGGARPGPAPFSAPGTETGSIQSSVRSGAESGTGEELR